MSSGYYGNGDRGERKSAAVLDFEKRGLCSGSQSTDSGVHEPAHRCSICARQSAGYVGVTDFFGTDHWQQVQLDWNAECDLMVRAHLPQHTGPGCKDCPEYPPKPVKPYER